MEATKKTCPFCQRINAGDALFCAGCSASLEAVAEEEENAGLSAFGMDPRIVPNERAGAKPLAEAVDARMAARSYGARKAASAEGAPDAAVDTGPVPTPSSFAPAGPSPKKPWER